MKRLFHIVVCSNKWSSCPHSGPGDDDDDDDEDDDNYDDEDEDNYDDDGDADADDNDDAPFFNLLQPIVKLSPKLA